MWYAMPLDPTTCPSSRHEEVHIHRTPKGVSSVILPILCLLDSVQKTNRGITLAKAYTDYDACPGSLILAILGYYSVGVGGVHMIVDTSMVLEARGSLAV